jgi:hypothetical protein
MEYVDKLKFLARLEELIYEFEQFNENRTDNIILHTDALDYFHDFCVEKLEISSK